MAGNRRSRRKGGDHGGGGHERWLVSYADMITLLFALFIVLYAMSKMNESKFQILSHSLAKAIEPKEDNILPGTLPATNSDPQGKRLLTGNSYSETRVETTKDAKPRGDKVKVGDEGDPTDKEKVLEDIKNRLVEELRHSGCPHAVHMHMEEAGLVVRLLEDRILFDIGEAEVRSEGRKMILAASRVLKGIDNGIRVEGNTDNLPVHSGRFRSNWELSTLRATNVAEVLIRGAGISPHRVSVLGHGEFKPLVPNTSDRNRQINRHVDIVVLRSR